MPFKHPQCITTRPPVTRAVSSKLLACHRYRINFLDNWDLTREVLSALQVQQDAIKIKNYQTFKKSASKSNSFQRFQSYVDNTLSRMKFISAEIDKLKGKAVKNKLQLVRRKIQTRVETEPAGRIQNIVSRQDRVSKMSLNGNKQDVQSNTVTYRQILKNIKKTARTRLQLAKIKKKQRDSPTCEKIQQHRPKPVAAQFKFKTPSLQFLYQQHKSRQDFKNQRRLGLTLLRLQNKRQQTKK